MHLPKNELSEKYFKKRYDAYKHFYRKGNNSVTQRERKDQRNSVIGFLGILSP
jgi:hypothetical protein